MYYECSNKLKIVKAAKLVLLEREPIEIQKQNPQLISAENFEFLPVICLSASRLAFLLVHTVGLSDFATAFKGSSVAAADEDMYLVPGNLSLTYWPKSAFISYFSKAACF